MRLRLLLLLLLFGFSTALGYAQFTDARFQVNGKVLPYLVSFPDDYDETKQYPLLIFLHGAGERGNDNKSQINNGKDFLLSNTKKTFPAIVIVPQCPSTSYWANVVSNTVGNKRTFVYGRTETPSESMEMLILLIQQWLSSGQIDSKQIYAGGLSMGGMGTFELLWRMPDTFTAAFAICGGGDVSKVSAYAKATSVWIFHGSDDAVVPVKFSQAMYKALREVGADVKYTEYPGINHNSWEDVFREKDLFPWLFSHKKK